MENLESDSLIPVGKSKGRGRPELPPGLRQNKPIMFRLDFHQMQRLKARAKAEGTTPSLLAKKWTLEKLGDGDHITGM